MLCEGLDGATVWWRKERGARSWPPSLCRVGRGDNSLTSAPVAADGSTVRRAWLASPRPAAPRTSRHPAQAQAPRLGQQSAPQGKPLSSAPPSTLAAPRPAFVQADQARSRLVCLLSARASRPQPRAGLSVRCACDARTRRGLAWHRGPSLRSGCGGHEPATGRKVATVGRARAQAQAQPTSTSSL